MVGGTANPMGDHMIRKLCLALAVTALPLVGASAAAAQDPQYPPTGGTSPNELTRDVSREVADPADPGATSAAPLARTGSDTGDLALVGGVLVAAGAVAAGGAAVRRRSAAV